MSWRTCLLVVFLAAVPLRGAIAFAPTAGQERSGPEACSALEAGDGCRTAGAGFLASDCDGQGGDFATVSQAPAPVPATGGPAHACPPYVAPAASCGPVRLPERPPSRGL